MTLAAISNETKWENVVMAIRHTMTVLPIVLAAFVITAQESHADYQALGVVATQMPAPLQCEDGLCTAYLSTFCLEQDRLPPPGRTAYRPSENTKVTLIVETATGETLRLAGNGWLRFETRTNYTGVLAIVDEVRLGALDPVKASVEVAPMAALLPAENSGGDRPHNAEEVALATGPYRQAAQNFFENNAAGTKAVSFATRLINSLPPSGNVSEERLKTIVTAALAAFDTSNAGPETRAEVNRLVDVCHVPFPRRWHMSMRICLEHEHGALQVSTNKRFWNSLGGV